MEDRLVKIGRIVLGFMFIFSALSKLISMPFFDSMVAELILGPEYFDNPNGMFWTQIMTRVLIAAELLLGVAILQKRFLKKLVLPGILGMLILFTIHLFYEGFSQPNGFTEGNCGCFGDVLPMNNLESIIKNVVALLIGLFVWRKYRNVPNQDLASWVSPILIGATTLFTLWFGIKTYDDSEEPVNLSTDIPIATVDSLSSDTIPADTANLMNKDQTEDNTEIQSTEDGNTVVVSDPASDEIKDANDPNVNNDNSDEVSVMEVTPNQHTINLINKHNKFSDGSKINFESGTSLICLFSMTCSHCQEVYKEMCQLNDQMPKTYLINFGAEFEQNYFFKQAGGCKLPHNRIEDFTQFKRLLEGKSYPRILVVKNGNIVRDWDVDSYSRAKLMKYFGMKEPTKKDDDGGLNLETGGSPW